MGHQAGHLRRRRIEMLDALKPQTAELAQAYAEELVKLQPK